jgi:hypothetical protein
MTQDTAALIATAHALADAARPATLAHFRNPALAVDSKGAGFDPVTAADREAEAAMRAILDDRRPDDADPRRGICQTPRHQRAGPGCSIRSTVRGRFCAAPQPGGS